MKAFELYSGIGGMHFALKGSGVDAEIVKAIDINPTANATYRHNFPKSILIEKNIQSLTEDDFNSLDIEMILMSPPCQPHTRNGLQKDKLDQRSDSLLHIISLVPKLKTVKFILLENVKGFEISTVRNELVDALKTSNYVLQEFLLTPTQFSIPNSRLRYYMLAKKKPLEFCFTTSSTVVDEMPTLKNEVYADIMKLNWKYKRLSGDDSCFHIEEILDKEVNYKVPDKVLMKYGTLFDIVTKESVKSCCFTKGYGHFVEGTGSVLSMKNQDLIENVFEKLKNYPKQSDESLQLLKSLELRYFTPKEIARLMCFPDRLEFPSNLTIKQKYRLLGNSINVHVVSLLIKILVS